jgi:hypothetical protein
MADPEGDVPGQPLDKQTPGVPLYKRWPFWLFLAVAVIFVIASVFVALNPDSIQGDLKKWQITPEQFVSSAFGVLCGAMMLILALSFAPDYSQVRIALILEVAGACLGWVLGMFFSPTSPGEQQTFLNAKTALVGILSGYLLSKLQSTFDAALKDGKILNQRFLLLALIFLSPMIFTAAAVYSNRAYPQQAVLVSGKLNGSQWAPDTATAKYQLPLSQKKVNFEAEARFSANTAVVWSMIPFEAGAVDPKGEAHPAHGSIDPNTGVYLPPTTMPSDPHVEVFATSLEDRTKVGEFEFDLKGPSAPDAEAPKQAPEPAHEAGASGTVKGKDSPPAAGKGTVAPSGQSVKPTTAK